MSDWKFLNAHRVKKGVLASMDDMGFNGAFLFYINALQVKVMASDGLGWQHVSVSLHASSLPPSWSIMCQIKDLFWEEDQWVVQFHPAHSEYVNNHPGCLHLWRPVGVELPVPHSLLVGIKGVGEVVAV